MKAKTKLQQRVYSLSQRLAPISERQKEWAFQHCFDHYGRRTRFGVGLNGCNDLIYRVVTFLYKIVGNEKETVCFQFVALKYHVSNNLSQDTKNLRN